MPRASANLEERCHGNRDSFLSRRLAFQHGNMIFQKILLVQLCPMVINEVEAFNVNISALEGESWNFLLESSLSSFKPYPAFFSRQ